MNMFQRIAIRIFSGLGKPLILLAGVFLVACATGEPPGDGNGENTVDSEKKYFKSPEQAVPRISEMLSKKQWKRLSSYYDLSGSEVDRKELETGRYFMSADTNARELPPPEKELAKYSHPFHPKYRFMRTEPTDREGVVRVELILEIEQGGNMPPRRTIDQFFMKKSSGGYRILPGDGK